MQNYNSTILLTGATGFLGSSILRKLVGLDYNVIIIKRSNSNISRIKDIIALKKIKICNVDNEDLELIFGENKINCIIHSAECIIQFILFSPNINSRSSLSTLQILIFFNAIISLILLILEFERFIMITL